ncbi:GNAT family N-acetyltransferase [uncultured Roseibium sp.]|uniref:GNAT family N-acetyltransferase n=1 Tax=uncultured Roseibium sp. TaxID=1936171 RepID=UPI0032163E12
MQEVVLKCGAVRLVPFSRSDLSLVQDLHCNAGLDRTSSPDPAVRTAEDAERFLAEAEKSRDRHGFSRWKVLSAEGRFLGWAGFAAFEETSEIELSYCFTEAALSKDPGLPSRMCRALADWFFDNTYFSHLVAMVRTDNKAARECLLETGFAYRESRRIAGYPCDVFQMLSPAMQTYVLSA